MATKHFLPNDTNNLVLHCLRAVATEYDFLSLLDTEKVIFHDKFDSSNVALVSGGGSGHEPGFYGLVGDGMLSAVAHGDVFASPNFKNVMAAEKACHDQPSLSGEWGGCIFILTNYTGDNLYFGMAAQELEARFGKEKIRIMRVTDDVAVGKSVGKLVGRRTLAGIAIVLKIMGAASRKQHSIDEIFRLGQAVNKSIASVNAGLDHVHISGHESTKFGQLGPNEVEIGLGIHNEPGVQKLNRIPRNEELTSILLRMILDRKDPERGFFEWTAGDDIVLLINNLGGVPKIEEKAIMYECLRQLESDYNIRPVRVFSNNFVTSFNAQIFTITLMNLRTAATAEFSSQAVLLLLDASTNAVCWPKPGGTVSSSRIIKKFTHYDDHKLDASLSADIKVSPDVLVLVVSAAALNLIAKEPELTEWDTRMGDGDCGHGLREGAKAVLPKLQRAGENGSVLQVLHMVLGVIRDDMGGTLGAILFIFMKALVTEFEVRLSDGIRDLPALFALSMLLALDNLYDYTKAREGHRTVMDVLIPFVQTFSQTQDIAVAVEAAHDAAEGTRLLRPKLGRATYVGIAEEKELPPDPGAYGIYEVLKAFGTLRLPQEPDLWEHKQSFDDPRLIAPVRPEIQS